MCLATPLLRASSADTVKQTDVNFPPSCMVDFTNTLEAPAGKHGFLTSSADGHFYWSDGTRARFWGINVSSTRLRIPSDQIEHVAENFARAGLNLVRLEAIDNRNCLLGATTEPDSQRFDPAYLDCIDRWTDAFRRHGIYYYFDLLDFRTFKDGDAVKNAAALDRGARPYAVFDRNLIQLQKDYAAKLLLHTNPYSGLRPVDDPALVMVEICNEHGLFLYPDKLDTLVEPYRSDLIARWNAWLKQKYSSRDALATAWGTIGGSAVLQSDEDVNGSPIDLPLLTRPQANANSTLPDVRRAPTRLHDGVEFLVSVQRDWFHEMRDYLRSIGLKAQVTAVVSNDVAPDVASVAQECDFTAENWYGDGGTDDPKTPDRRYFGNRNPLRDDSTGGVAPYTAGLRWNNKPVVIREWAVPWPNRWRAASVPEMLSYASLQDYDAVLLFGYQTNRAPDGAEADALNDFAFQCDPPVWGLYALAGQAFLSRAIRPADHTLTLYYPDAHRFDWPNGLTELHRAAWCVKLSSTTEKPTTSQSVAPTGTANDAQLLQKIFNYYGSRTDLPLAKSYLAGVWRSDTNQITRFTRDGRLQVITPRLRMLAGELAPDQIYTLGGLKFSSPTPMGAFMAYSLDNLPIERSKHVVIKMVSRAQNTGEVFEKAPPNSLSDWCLRNLGAAPVVTYGRVSQHPLRVWIEAPSTARARRKAANPVLTLWMVDGTWELEMKDGHATLACDTPGLYGNLLGQAFTTTGDTGERAARNDSPPDVPADTTQ
jgi:hypothetical protein